MNGLSAKPLGGQRASARAAVVSTAWRLAGSACICSAWLAGAVAGRHVHADVILVENGRAQAVVVVADTPSPVAAYAAEELAHHVALATGVSLPVVRESDVTPEARTRVYVGVTRAAAARGMDAAKLTHDRFRMRTDGGDLFLLGAEDADALPLSHTHGYSGTLFAVYELLERVLAVRWLWPGPLGTFVPRRETITVSDMDEVVAPRLLLREISNPGDRLAAFANGKEKKPPEYPEHYRQLAFATQEQATRYVRDYEVFMRRHRLGQSQPLRDERAYMVQHKLNVVRMESVYRLPRPLHAFHGWWGRFGETHPDWFAMREDGTRTPRPTDPYQGRVAAMCVSNPDLHRFLAEEVVRTGRVYKVGPRTVWDGRGILDLSEADLAYERLCQCPACRAWDGPQETSPLAFVNEKNRGGRVSDRYARFWKTVYDLAVKRCPGIKIPVYIYHNYYQAPLGDIHLGPDIIGEFVLYGVAGNFPMTPDEFRWNREQWLGWHRTGVTLVLRPNYLLAGYEMPEITTRQIASFFNFAGSNGLAAVGFEGKGGFPWAAQGPMAYLHYRLLWNPGLTAEAVADEYYTAFGPAAPAIREYFDYWESYVRDRPPLRTRIPAGMDVPPDEALEHINRPVAAVIGYPPSVYPPAEAILARAQAAVREAPNPDFARRVAFIRAGLDHARLSARLHEHLDYRNGTQGAAPTDPAALRQARQAMQALIDFRRAHADLYVSDYLAAARVEQSVLNAPMLFPGQAGAMEREQAFRARWPLAATRRLPANAAGGTRVPLPREGWLFREDVRREGDLAGWHRAEAAADDWLPARIGVPWGQFLPANLIGVGWYRDTLAIPDHQPGSRVHLVFEGVDETCWVWVNGQLVGGQDIGSTGWDKPFRLDITRAVRPGENRLAVRVENIAFAGGIWRPVFLEIIPPRP